MVYLIKDKVFYFLGQEESVTVFYDINPFSDKYTSIFLLSFTVLCELFVFCSIHAALEAQCVDGIDLHKLEAVNTDTIKVVEFRFFSLSLNPACPDITGI